jgi:hypothetical protein
MSRLPRTPSTKTRAVRINRTERRAAKVLLHVDPERVEDRQPRGRAIWESH